MQPQAQAQYAARAKVIKAMAHPTRLFVVEELSQHGQRCVCELTAMIGADMSTVSRHLTILKNAGIVGTRNRVRRSSTVSRWMVCSTFSRVLIP